MIPHLQPATLAAQPPTTSGGVRCRSLVVQRRVPLADQLQKFVIQVEVAYGNQIDQYQRNSLSQQSGALGRELMTVLDAILVPRTDDLDGGHKTTAAANVVDADLILVEVGQLGFDRQGGFRRRRAAAASSV